MHGVRSLVLVMCWLGCLAAREGLLAQDACPVPDEEPACTAGQGLACCDLAHEPGGAGTQACANGHSCCASGDWSCNDDASLSTCHAAGTPCERCCDPAGEPGVGSNPICFEGATCCSTGNWRCNDATGESTCATDGRPCLECCDPNDEPGHHGNAPCFEGATCCASGDWTCNDANGTSTCEIDGRVCPRCCDPLKAPGAHDNPPCANGTRPTCCTSGEWECHDSIVAETTCNPNGRVCHDRCCDPGAEPGFGNNPPCIEGATCCGDGRWACNEGSGESTCESPGRPCERCCDALDQPGAFGNPPCFEGSTCCSDGGWQCNDAGGQSTCDADGRRCLHCCDPDAAPGTGNNPPCFEGATCCADGDWQCNDGAGESTCALDGAECGPRCCEQDERPDITGNAQCATGFSCCGDGKWRCNDSDGNPTCDDDPGRECPKICGGIAGLPCDDDEFCKLPPGECCCDHLGVCIPRPDACPLYYDPVCGCDGQTYGNACEADAAGVSVEHPGRCEQTCGGFAGGECPDGQFCKLADGECCCDFEGVCRDLPQGCPDVWDPVCGCDGQTYGNECDASAAGVSVEHRGACGDNDREVEGVRFDAPQRLRWDEQVGAKAYNVYVKRVEERPPDDYGRCLYSAVPVTGVAFPVHPPPKGLWWIQVTALFPGGEGPMGQASDGTVRKPVAPCSCTLPPVTGPCEALIPRWYHDWQDNTCKEFTWGGCGGNANNFVTEAECRQTCDDVCALPVDPGPCDGAFPRWFHNADTGKCEEFVYGGCAGNANNFMSKEICEARCADGTVP